MKIRVTVHWLLKAMGNTLAIVLLALAGTAPQALTPRPWLELCLGQYVPHLAISSVASGF